MGLLRRLLLRLLGKEAVEERHVRDGTVEDHGDDKAPRRAQSKEEEEAVEERHVRDGTAEDHGDDEAPRRAQSKEEAWASFMCRLASMVINHDRDKAKARMVEFIDMLHENGLPMLLNHLFDKLCAGESVSRQCLPTEVHDLTHMLEVIQPLNLEHCWVKGPESAGGKYNAFNVLYHMKTITKVNIDMRRVSKDNELLIVAIATGCLYGSLGRFSSPENILEAGLDIAKEVAALPSDLPTLCCPPPYPQQPLLTGPPALTRQPNNDSKKEG